MIILSFILFQIIRSQLCNSYDDQHEDIQLSLSDQEVIQIPFNELIHIPSTLILCDKNQQNDISIIEEIQLFQQYPHDTNQKVQILKQYKNTKNRMANQSTLIIAYENIQQLVRFSWGKDPKFHNINSNGGIKLDTLESVQEDLVFLNHQSEVRIVELFPPFNLKVQQEKGCNLTPKITDQLNNSIYSVNIDTIMQHNDWQSNFLCFGQKLLIDCQYKSNNIKVLQIYSTQIITFMTEKFLVKSNLQSDQIYCEMNSKILAYDYDIVKMIFVTVYADKIVYNGELHILNLNTQSIKVFLTKKFIVLHSGQTIQLFSKQLKLISTKTFQDHFQIITNQLQDQFILVNSMDIQRYLLYDTSYIEINTKRNKASNFLQDLYDPDNHKFISLITQSDYIYKLNKLNISKTKEVSTIFEDKILDFYQCRYDELIMGQQQFYQYNKLLNILTYNVSIFDLDNYKIIYAFSRSFIYFGMIHNTDLIQFKQYPIQDEIITKQNYAFQIQDNKINYIHCTPKSCYLYYDIMRIYQQKKSYKIEHNEALKIVSDNNQFYLQTTKNVICYTINSTERQIKQQQILEIDDQVLDIFASPKKKDYLFVLTQSNYLYLYSISLPYQDLIQIFKLNYNELIEFIIFEDYFLIFNKQKQQIICDIYNYKNELNIFLQRQLPIFFFKSINFDGIQVDYDQNILYLKGLLISSDEYVIVTYRIDTREELSIQYISKINNQFGFLLPISNRLILRYENKYNFTSIFYNYNKQTSCLITKLQQENLIDDDSDDDESDDDSETEQDEDNTLSLDENYQFSANSFISISSAGELLILGMQSVYGRKRHLNNIDNFQPL